MARKITGLTRVLDERSIASVAFGEIASSIYFALGIVALYALGFTPLVLLLVGGLFFLVALSYAEGTTAIPETGGGATFVRRAFNDPAGFLTGWVLFLDYLIVIALAALFVPHYFGTAVQWTAITHRPWNIVAGLGVVVAVAAVRLVRRPGLYRIAVAVAGIALVSQLVLLLLGFIYLFSWSALSRNLDLGVAPTWGALAFALPVAMLAYTGLETVANLAAETREPGRTLPRSLFAGIGAVVLLSVAIGAIGVSAYPAHPDPRGPGGWATSLGTSWARAPLVGIAAAFGGHLPGAAVDALRIFVGLTGVVILVAAVTTSISGAGRLAYSLGKHAMLPHIFGVLNRRTLIPPISILSAAAISCALLGGAYWFERPVRALASLYSFGVLLAFTAAQLAVIRLRFTEPELERPYRVPLNVRIRGRHVPVAPLVGVPLTAAIWVAALATHPAARIAGPLWLVTGMVIFVGVRLSHGEGLTERVRAPVADLVPAPEGIYERIVVPVKLGPIGEEVLATAIKLGEERRSSVHALHVIRVPLDQPLDAALTEAETRADASLAEAGELAAEHGVEVQLEVVRARSIGEAIVAKADELEADLIVLGSAPRWRRQSRFFSPTVDYVLRKAACEVMVMAYPQGVLDEVAEPEEEPLETVGGAAAGVRESPQGS